MRAELNWYPPDGDPYPLNPIADPLVWVKPRPPKTSPQAATDLSSRDIDRVDRWRERNSRSRVASAFRESPSWLASVVLHALAMVILGSLAGKQIRAARAPITLTMTMTEHDGQELTFSAPTPVDASEQNKQNAEDANEPTTDSIFAEPAPLPAAELAAEEESLFDGIAEFVEQPTETTTVSFVDDTSTTPLEESPFADVQREQATDGVSPNQFAGRSTNRLDQIVDNFIEFDLGRLRGKAAHQANRAFHALGPDAIPALVRGLNKSAYISASCPVVVISSKLYETVQNSNDPEMLRYALAQVGENVPQDAPHYRRLQAVRKQLSTLTEEGQKELRRKQRRMKEEQRKAREKQLAERRARQEEQEQQELAERERRIERSRQRNNRRGNNSPQNQAIIRQQQMAAQRLLQTAARLRRQRQGPAAAQILKQVVQRYPKTQEAKVARKLLSR